MLKGMPILIVEDEPLVALELAAAIEDIDGRPIGPVPTIGEALVLLRAESVAAAILDANLRDGAVTPVAELLMKSAVPFIVHTGTGLPPELAARYPDLPVIMKPAPTSAVLAALLDHVSPDRSRFQ